MVSNKAINRLGKEIAKNNGEINDEQLSILQEFRTSFSHPLSSTFHKIRKITDKVDRDAIVAFRIKRIGTIVNKLIRQPDMQLSTMGDIAGIRCIFKTHYEVYQALKLIQSKFVQSGKLRDYIENPKILGYKGIHIYVKAPNGKRVEIQLRTEKDHNWATLVEITDFIYGLRLKELGFESDQNFAAFHSLMSSDKALTKNEVNLIYDVLEETDFISELSYTFRKNNNEVKRRWANQKKSHSFFLIEVSKGEIPILQSFSSYKKAEDEYFKRYKENDNTEIVLTSIRKPNFKQISIAYANYILTYHNFINDIKPILKEMAREAIENKEYLKFKKIFITYEKLHTNIVLDTLFDSTDVFFIGMNKGKVKLKTNKNISRYKELQIAKNLTSKLLKNAGEHEKFIIEIKEKIPQDFISKIKFSRFLNKHNKRLKKRLDENDFEFEDLKK